MTEPESYFSSVPQHSESDPAPEAAALQTGPAPDPAARAEASLSRKQLRYVRQRRLQLKKERLRRRKQLLARGLFAGGCLLLALLLIGGLLLSSRRSRRSPGSFRTDTDRVCYLAAKYESNASPASVGKGIGYVAYGEFQFYYKYCLRPFVTFCLEKDPDTYAAFLPFRDLSEDTVPDKDFRAAWKQIASDSYGQFENDQQAFVVSYTLKPALQALDHIYSYDFLRASDALQACVLSFANRDGRYPENLSPFFDGCDEALSEEEIIRTAYTRMQEKRPEEKRWVKEEEDCLALLAGSLDIYHVSKNEAGGIDWSWK